MEDIISLENALADCEYEIDSLTGSKRHYDDLVGFSTFSVTLDEVQTLTATPEGSGFGAQLTQAAKTGTRGLVDSVRALILGIVMFWPVVLLLAAGGGAAVVITKNAPEKCARPSGRHRPHSPSFRPKKTRRNNRKEPRHRSKSRCLRFIILRFSVSSSSSFASMSNSFASASRLDVLGSDVPLSHLDTACRLTPIDSATNSCVILHAVRCCFSTAPSVFAVSAFSRPDGCGTQIFPQRPDQQHKYINGYAHDGKRWNDRIQCHYHGTSSFSALSIIEKLRLHNQLSRNRSKKS